MTEGEAIAMFWLCQFIARHPEWADEVYPGGSSPKCELAMLTWMADIGAIDRAKTVKECRDIEARFGIG